MRSGTIAASLLIGSALGALAIPAYAQQPTTAAAPQSAAAKSVAPAAEAVPAKVQVFETSPELRQATLKAVAAGVIPDADKATAASLSGTAPSPAATPRSLSQPQDEVKWMLDANSRPWPLAYTELAPLNVLSFALPTEREARIMLAGAVADTTDRARFIVSRYVTDNIGAAAQARGRQLESFSLWADSVQRQKKAVPSDPWAQYQFSVEVQATLAPFKEKVAAQTAPTVQRMADDINAAVAKITPLMNVMGSYEQQLQWYNILVQLKEGAGLYQTRTLESDRQILDAIQAFERDNPPVPRPAGKPPVKPADSGSMPAAQATPAATIAAAPAQREPAQAPARQQQTGMSGGVVLLIVGAMVIGFFVMLRKRVKGKGLSAKPSAE